MKIYNRYLLAVIIFIGIQYACFAQWEPVTATVKKTKEEVEWWRIPPTASFPEDLSDAYGRKITFGGRTITFDKTNSWKEGEYARDPDGAGKIWKAEELIELFDDFPLHTRKRKLEAVIGPPTMQSNNLAVYEFYCIDADPKKRCLFMIRYRGDINSPDNSDYIAWIKMMDFRQIGAEGPRASGKFNLLHKTVEFR